LTSMCFIVKIVDPENSVFQIHLGNCSNT